MATLSALKSPLGLFKFILIGLLCSIVGLSYLGNEGDRLYFGLQDYLGVGVAVGFSIIIPIILVAYIFDGSLFVLESLLSLVGAGLFVTVGVITLDSYSHPQYGAPAGKALAGLCFSTAAVFVLNLVAIFCTMRK